MFEIINFFLGGLSDLQLMAGLILMVVVIDKFFDVLKQLIGGMWR